MSALQPPLGTFPPLDAPPPPADLTPDAFAERLYASLAPLAEYDSEVAWALLILCNAIGLQYELIEDWVRDTPAGDPGWSLLLDLNRCPPVALPWLAQFVGVRLPPRLTEAEQRAWIASTDGFKRGTRQALIGAAASTLTGAQRVVFRERNGNPADVPDYAYVLDVVTYDGDTPDPAATLRALLAQKPGGIVLNYAHHPGQDYQSVRDGNATYAALRARYASYAAVLVDTPVV